jgi:hypothetical protein
MVDGGKNPEPPTIHHPPSTIHRSLSTKSHAGVSVFVAAFSQGNPIA